MAQVNAPWMCCGHIADGSVASGDYHPDLRPDIATALIFAILPHPAHHRPESASERAAQAAVRPWFTREVPFALPSAGLCVCSAGALKEAGMPQFAELTRQEVNQIYAYVRAKAREAPGLRKAVAAPTGTAAKL